MINRLKTFAQNHSLEFCLIILILIVAAFLRLYKIDQYMRFLGDEGRDALVVLHLVRNFNLPLLGPVTSVGNIYAGPLYYYMMLIPMFLGGLSPVGAAVMVALLGVASVFLIYYLGRLLFHPVIGLIASALYAVSYLPVSMAKSSWNPYPMPFFALLIVLSMYKVVVDKKPKWLVLAGIAFAFALQMHWLCLILVPFIGLLWLLAIVWYKKQKIALREFFVYTAWSAGAFLLLMSPLLVFDLRHNFLNFNNFVAFFNNRETSVNINPLNTVGRMWQSYNDLYVARFLIYPNQIVGPIISFAIPVVLLGVAYLWRSQPRKLFGLFIIVLWVVTSVVGLSLVKSHIYDHYLGFFNPAIYLLFACAVAFFWEMHTHAKFITIGLAAIFIMFNAAKSPLQESPGRQLQRTQFITRSLITDIKDKPFNFALIAKNNYDDGYRFYFEKWQHPVTRIDASKLDQTLTDQLYVVCEDPICEPVNNDRTEIASFGYATIDWGKELDGLKAFRLVHPASQ